MDPIADDVNEKYLTTPLPLSFWSTTSSDHLLWSPAAFLEWLKSNPFVHRPSGVVYGGPGGIRWAFFAILRMILCVPFFHTPNMRAALPDLIDMGLMTRLIGQMLTTLEEQLRLSETIVKSLHDERCALRTIACPARDLRDNAEPRPVPEPRLTPFSSPYRAIIATGQWFLH